MREQRFHALDSWRGICALAVALFHFPIVSLIGDSTFIGHSYLFVDFFFVLSGFVIATASEGRLTGAAERINFIIRRIGRIWPLHVAMLLLFIAVAVARGQLGADERHSVEAIFTNLLMVQAWGLHHDLTWNDPSWSISVEWCLYLLFAFLSVLPWRRFAYAFFVMAGIGTLFFFAPDGMASTFDFGVARGLAGFFTGALIVRMPLRRFGTAAEAAAILGVIIFVTVGEALFVAPFVFGAAVYVFAASDGVAGRFLKKPLFLWLGARSYSIYMVHAAVVAALWAISGPMGWRQNRASLVAGDWGDLIAVAYIAAVLVASAVAYRLVEQPGIRAFRRITVVPATAKIPRSTASGSAPAVRPE